MAERRKGPWVLSRSGRRIYYLDPRPRDFCVADVARGLAGHARWAAQTIEPYNVAQHSVLTVELVEEDAPQTDPLQLLRVLFHDAPEAFMSELTRPLKYELKEYRRLEKRMLSVMCVAFGLPAKEPAALERAHARAQATERRDLYPRGERRMRVAGEPRAEPLRVWDWREAEARFLAVYDRLLDGIGGARGAVSRRLESAAAR
jgi:hypothetical protein